MPSLPKSPIPDTTFLFLNKTSSSFFFPGWHKKKTMYWDDTLKRWTASGNLSISMALYYLNSDIGARVMNFNHDKMAVTWIYFYKQRHQQKNLSSSNYTFEDRRSDSIEVDVKAIQYRMDGLEFRLDRLQTTLDKLQTTLDGFQRTLSGLKPPQDDISFNFLPYSPLDNTPLLPRSN